jgi:hypothetical protein
MDARIKFGKLEGQYFSQAKLDQVLIPLAEQIFRSFRVAEMPEIKEIQIFYDQAEDYHHAAFEIDGHKIDIRYYKVLACTIDGERGRMVPLSRPQGYRIHPLNHRSFEKAKGTKMKYLPATALGIFGSLAVIYGIYITSYGGCLVGLIPVAIGVVQSMPNE